MMGRTPLSIARGWCTLSRLNQIALPGDSLEPVLLANLQRIQEASALPVSAALEGPHFTVEMETGTGKTYVYLRTVFESSSPQATSSTKARHEAGSATTSVGPRSARRSDSTSTGNSRCTGRA